MNKNLVYITEIDKYNWVINKLNIQIYCFYTQRYNRFANIFNKLRYNKYNIAYKSIIYIAKVVNNYYIIRLRIF